MDADVGGSFRWLRVTASTRALRLPTPPRWARRVLEHPSPVALGEQAEIRRHPLYRTGLTPHPEPPVAQRSNAAA
jgi:hypothetical protein